MKKKIIKNNFCELILNCNYEEKINKIINVYKEIDELKKKQEQFQKIADDYDEKIYDCYEKIKKIKSEWYKGRHWLWK